MNPDRCPDCGAEVRVVTTVAGRRVLIDPHPHPDGSLVPILVGDEMRACVVSQPSRSRPNYRPHAVTCPG